MKTPKEVAEEFLASFGPPRKAQEGWILLPGNLVNVARSIELMIEQDRKGLADWVSQEYHEVSVLILDTLVKRLCPLCSNASNTSICAECALKAWELGERDIPPPDAGKSQVEYWIKNVLGIESKKDFDIRKAVNEGKLR